MRQYASPITTPKRAFSLVELLVVVAIIAVLIGILAPGLRMARRSAQNARCLSNLHQIAVGWNAYTAANRWFPTQEGVSARCGRVYGHYMMNWGGADFQRDGAAQGGGLTRERPMNPYIVSDDLRLRSSIEVFRCPGDDGMRQSNEDWPEQPFSPSLVENSVMEDPNEAVYLSQGTSYRANDWLWAPVGRRNGWWNPRNLYCPVYARNQPASVFSPSRFILVADHGAIQIARWSEETYSVGAGVYYGWWHAKKTINIGFLDGSARQEPTAPGEGATDRWSFWLDERLHQEGGSYVCAFSFVGTPRARLPRR